MFLKNLTLIWLALSALAHWVQMMPEGQVRIPRCMSTQHPDNVSPPFFAESSELGGEDEIQEAYYVFSHLHCDEQMWDCEGKEVDGFVVKKLLSRYEKFFSSHQLGKDLFITLRVPNPTIERDEAKILLETLESIPRSFDTAHLFYRNEVPPIFEVILPMTSSARSVDRIYHYYKDFVVGKQSKAFAGDITIAEWIGTFEPKSVNVIPLFEDLEHMLGAADITKAYLQDKDVDHQRVFLARSDPAMNYGLVSAVLMNKIALARFDLLQSELGIGIYPIIGVGSAPFRGNFRPSIVDRIMDEYPSVHTFTMQSSFKYDHSPDEVWKAAEKIYERPRAKAQEVDEEQCIRIIERYSEEYRKQVKNLAPIINEVARYVPSRRKRKLHIGLFGYSRNLDGVALPRAISFTSALYSIGLPPELLALNALSEKDLDFVREVWKEFDADLKDALQFSNPESFRLLSDDLKQAVDDLGIDFQIHEGHREISSFIMGNLRTKSTKRMEEAVLRAASLRGFLG